MTTTTVTLVRLKLALLRNGLRGSTGRRAAYIATLVVVLLVAALQLIGLIALRGSTHAVTLCVILTAVLALGWAVMPLFFPPATRPSTRRASSCSRCVRVRS